MKKNTTPVYYGDYLHLDRILSAQELQSEKYATAAHDETLFIIVHQVYELWFKQILHELSTVIDVFSQQAVEDHQLSTVVHRLNRVIKIQKLLNDQISIMETMTPQEFLSFRDYLVPASGFQSIQFKMLEIGLGLKSQYRIDFDKQSFYQRLEEKDRHFLEALEQKQSLFELVNAWLERLPLLEFDNFKFWQHYESATKEMLKSDREIIKNNNMISEEDRQKELLELQKTEASFNAIFDEQYYQKLMEEGHYRLSQNALMSALFIHQYSEEPVFNLPFQFLTCLTEIDENLTLWRYRHAMMVQRMLGTKIGTGGSSGHEYLKKTTESNRIFKDFFNMATFLLPKEVLPALPVNVKKNLGFSLFSV
ncbi:tryptophan 2,3-dioxygenase family protein [Planctobacterium marinum]|uniref:tryptophan 2,3-dioxygenase family protein n=1 Tax=Planctobacterium marinum TaxID=1631968 RepID=UPI001E5DCF9F|nr:tryptophan 2,3-dioxygenase family protein [Planctobacterium marinum]MCC2605518.1 tryptophan 2,3-dioxygenase [Planctobacterium marinum]